MSTDSDSNNSLHQPLQLNVPAYGGTSSNRGISPRASVLLAEEAAEATLSAEIDEEVILPLLRDKSPAARHARRRAFYRAVIGEYMATMIFFFCGCGVSVNLTASGFTGPAANLTAALGFAMVAIANIYTWSEVSGAHFNPAVTFAVRVVGKTSNRKFIFFIIAQLLGANSAMFLIYLCFDLSYADIFENDGGLKIVPPSDNLGHVFFTEFCLAFILVLVIFFCVFDVIEAEKKQQMTLRGIANTRGLTVFHAGGASKLGFAPISIGLIIGVLILIGGSVSGACFNPSRLFSSALWSGHWYGHWAYYLAHFSGAGSAALVNHLIGKLGKTGEEYKKIVNVTTPAAAAAVAAARSARNSLDYAGQNSRRGISGANHENDNSSDQV